MRRSLLLLTHLCMLSACGADPDATDGPDDTDATCPLEVCDDGVDNDCDGDVDEADSDCVAPGAVRAATFATGQGSVALSFPVTRADGGVWMGAQAGGFVESFDVGDQTIEGRLAMLALDEQLAVAVGLPQELSVQPMALSDGGRTVLAAVAHRQAVRWGTYDLPDLEVTGFALANLDASGNPTDLRRITSGQDVTLWAATDVPGGGHAAIGGFLPDVQIAGSEGTSDQVERTQTGMYVARWSADGAVQNVAPLGGMKSRLGSTTAQAIDADNNGNLWVASVEFAGGARFLDVNGDPLPLSGGARENGVVLNVAPEGHVRWLTELSGPLREYVSAVQATPDGGACIAGLAFEGSVLGWSRPSAYTFQGAGAIAFVARLDAEGEVVWVDAFASSKSGGRVGASPYGVLADEQGGCVFLAQVSAWSTDEQAVLGAGQSDEARFDVPIDASHAVVGRYDGDGALRWAQAVGGAAFLTPRGVAWTGEGAVAVTAYYNGAISVETPEGMQSRDSEGELHGVAYILAP